MTTVQFTYAGDEETRFDRDCYSREHRRMIETNVFGLIEMTRAALPALRERRGRIVNFSSVGDLVSYGRRRHGRAERPVNGRKVG